MNRYKCPNCKGNQYSASPNKSDEPCIYCGNPKVQMMDTLEERTGENETLQGCEFEKSKL